MNVYIPNKSELEKLSHEALVNRFHRACSDGNEFDNRTAIAAIRAELLKRLRTTSPTG